MATCATCGLWAWLRHGECTVCAEGYQSKAEYEGEDNEDDDEN